MEEFFQLFSLIFDLMTQEFIIWGFSFSIWQVVVMSCLAGIIGYIIQGIFEVVSSDL